MNPPFELPRMEEEHEVQLAYDQQGGWVPMTPTAPQVDYALGRLAGREAKRYSKHFDKHTKLGRRRKRHLAGLRWSDLEIGKLLGMGNFSHVYEVHLCRKEPIEDDSVTIMNSMRTISTNVWDLQSNTWNDPKYDDRDMWELVSVTDEGDKQGDGGDHHEDNPGQNEDEHPCYALKHLHPSVAKNEEDFTSGVIDLVLEAKLLANLKHDNIVKLHAVTEGSISRVFCGGGYFLLLDRLYGTLEDRIEEWKRAAITPTVEPAQSSIRKRRFSLFSSSKGRHAQSKLMGVPSIEDRLRTVALGLARGLEYLHAHRIMYRDLKPSNVGFSASGTVKIFDFGLAREILDGEQRMTANTGSLRYMAPEVNIGENYGVSADIYSYGILLWELCTLLIPFDGMTTVDHSKYVVHGGARPKIDKVQGSQDLRYLIQACWHADAKKRPSSTGVRNALLMQLACAREKHATDDAHKMEKSSRHSSMKRLRQRLIPQTRRRSSTRYREVDEQTIVRDETIGATS
jgi:serine/threonine protein kinase